MQRGEGALAVYSDPDGWVSVEEPDWVRAANGDVTVLVHHRTFDLRELVTRTARSTCGVAPTQAVLHAKITKVLDGDGTNWAPLLALSNLNKFSVAAADLPGQWASSSGASVDYVSVYTGNSAGTAYASSTSTFTLNPNGTYESVWKGAMNAQDGRGTQFGQERYKGTYSVKEWEVTRPTGSRARRIRSPHNSKQSLAGAFCTSGAVAPKRCTCSR